MILSRSDLRDIYGRGSREGQDPEIVRRRVGVWSMMWWIQRWRVANRLSHMLAHRLSTSRWVLAATPSVVSVRKGICCTVGTAVRELVAMQRREFDQDLPLLAGGGDQGTFLFMVPAWSPSESTPKPSRANIVAIHLQHHLQSIQTHCTGARITAAHAFTRSDRSRLCDNQR
jgi:hypothetical protein